MVMSHNLHNNLGNWCIFPENLLIYQGKLVEAANSLRRRNNSLYKTTLCILNRWELTVVRHWTACLVCFLTCLGSAALENGNGLFICTAVLDYNNAILCPVAFNIETLL